MFITRNSYLPFARLFSRLIQAILIIMPKVLHLIHSFNQGGIENWLISMLRQIPRNKCEIDFCCKGKDIGPLAAIAQALGAKVFHCPLGLTHFGFAQKLKYILQSGQYEILHNHSETYSGFPAWIARQLGIPVITSFHNTNFAPQTSLTRFPLLRGLRSIYGAQSIGYALRYSDLVTGCSQGVIQSLDPQGTKIKQPSQVLYYGVNLPKKATSPERATFRHFFGCESETPIVLHVGRLIEQKNHLGILAVFKLVLEQIPTAKLLLVGEGPLRSVIEDAITERGLSKSILLLGLRNDVPSLMSKSDVFLFPSIYEGFGLVAIEANAAGLPVVCSRIPGLVEAVQDGETALLHDVKDIAGMAQSVVKLLDDRTYREQLGHAGQSLVKNQYSTEKSATHLLEIYNSFVS
jgi:glycosyltransferase involved in cell wall biosynthesis